MDLSEKGLQEAQEAGRVLKAEGYAFDLAYTSVLKRAIRTLWLALDEMDLMWIPVHPRLAAERAPLRRAAGPEQVRDGREVRRGPGEDLAAELRHSAAGAGEDRPALSRATIRAIKDLTEKELPLTECLKDTVARFLPCWHETIAPQIRAGKRVLIAAHGNSLRALVKYLDNVSENDIVDLNIPTGMPLVYELDDDLKPIRSYYLGDPEKVKAAMEAVAAQGKAKA